MTDLEGSGNALTTPESPAETKQKPKMIVLFFFYQNCGVTAVYKRSRMTMYTTKKGFLAQLASAQA